MVQVPLEYSSLIAASTSTYGIRGGTYSGRSAIDSLPRLQGSATIAVQDRACQSLQITHRLHFRP